MIIFKSISAFFILMAGLVTVIYPLKTKRAQGSVESYEIAETFASGVFLGVAFFHMLPNAIDAFKQLYGSEAYPFAEMVCIGAFLFLIFLERLSYLNHAFKQELAIPGIMALILLIHSLTEGIALGVETNQAEALVIFLAILAHKGCDSFALCVTLMRYHFPTSKIIWTIVFFSLTTPIGIGLGTLVTLAAQTRGDILISALFNAFAAGSFLYIATLHHIRFHHQHEEEKPMLKFTGLLVGTLAMAIIAVWI